MTKVWYHAITEYGESKKRYWWNQSRDALVSEVLVPLLSKQVVVSNRRGKKILFNFGGVSTTTFLKTPEGLDSSVGGGAPSELKDEAFINKYNATQEFVAQFRVLQSAPATRSLIQLATATPENQIFVVMKFGDATIDSAYEGVIKPLGEEFGYKVLRVDEIQDSGQITSQVFESIASSKIILVELSGERPNCYYEAGYAHALGKEIIFCIRKGEPVHFDVAGYRFIQRDTEATFRRELRKRLHAYARKGEGTSIKL
jgi:hypothetical protein